MTHSISISNALDCPIAKTTWIFHLYKITKGQGRWDSWDRIREDGKKLGLVFKLSELRMDDIVIHRGIHPDPAKVPVDCLVFHNVPHCSVCWYESPDRGG